MLVFEPATASDLEAIVSLEQASYPADEGAPEETVRKRHQEAGDYFRAVFESDGKGARELVGFINGTRADAYTKQALREHQPKGRVLCVHSVVVAPAYRRKQVATQMLRVFLDVVLQDTTVEKVVVLCKPHHAVLYTRVGFELKGVSAVQHGSEAWLEMELDATSWRHLGVVQVDAFTSTPFAGNPAAVVVFKPGPQHHDDDEWMQHVGNEMHISETSFLVPVLEKPEWMGPHQLPLRLVGGAPLNRYKLRWFTPILEVALCGHATLAAAHVLFSMGFADRSEEIVFETRHSGELRASVDSNNRIHLNFPAVPPTKVEAAEHAHIASLVAAGVGAMCTPEDVLFVGRNSQNDVLCEIPTALFTRITEVNMSKLEEVECRGLILTCESSPPPSEAAIAAAVLAFAPAEGDQAQANGDHGKGEVRFDFASRYFGPRCGIGEDPVCGSAHCCLGPYWIERLGRATPGKMVGWQKSERGGVVSVSIKGDGRVRLAGSAATTIVGKLTA